MKPIATSLPTTIEEFQLALEAAFAGGQTLGKALANADKPAREWVGLTDEEIQKLAHVYDNTAPWTLMGFARAIEAKLREKNA